MHPHLSRRGTIQIFMSYSIHIFTSRDGMRRGGMNNMKSSGRGEMIPEENCNLQSVYELGRG